MKPEDVFDYEIVEERDSPWSPFIGAMAAILLTIAALLVLVLPDRARAQEMPKDLITATKLAFRYTGCYLEGGANWSDAISKTNGVVTIKDRATGYTAGALCELSYQKATFGIGARYDWPESDVIDGRFSVYVKPGYMVLKNLQLYAVAGVNFADISYGAALGTVGKDGFVYGAGARVDLGNNVLAFVEWNTTYYEGSFNNLNLTRSGEDVVRFGLAYRFIGFQP